MPKLKVAGKVIVVPKSRKLKPGELQAMKKIARREVNRNKEDHYYDRTAISALAVAYTGSAFYSCTPTIVGTNDTERIGDQIIPTYWRVRGTVVASDPTNLMRVMLVQYKLDASNEPASLGKILSNTYYGTVVYPLAPYNHDNLGKAFKILKDVTFALDTYNPIKKFDFKIKRKQMSKVSFAASGTTPVKGQLFIIAVSDSAVSTHPVLSATSRLHFIP